MIDPVTMVKGREAVMRKHEKSVQKLHRAMTSCKEVFFSQPEIPMKGWGRDFQSVEGAAGTR